MARSDLLGVLEGGANHASAGVVDQNVDMTERLDRRGRQVVGRAGLVQFADEAAGDLRMLIYALQVFLAAGRCENRGAVGDQPHGDSQANTGGGAGHDRRPAAQCADHRMIATSATERRSVISNSARFKATRKPPSPQRSRYRYRPT